MIELLAFIVETAVVLALLGLFIKFKGVNFRWPSSAEWLRFWPRAVHVRDLEYTIQVPPLFMATLALGLGGVVYSVWP